MQALVHSSFFLPAGVVSVVFYEVAAASNYTNVVLVPWLLWIFFTAFSSIGSLADFIIYCSRIPSFRATLCLQKVHWFQLQPWNLSTHLIVHSTGFIICKLKQKLRKLQRTILNLRTTSVIDMEHNNINENKNTKYWNTVKSQ